MTEEQIINIRCSIWYNCLLEIESNQPTNEISSVQSLSHIWLFATPWIAVHQASLFITIPETTQTYVRWAIQPSHCLPSPSPPALNLPCIRIFSNESTFCIRWTKYWSFSFSISPSNQYSGLITFRMDWFDLLAIQGTPKNLLQHHNSKASILQCSAFFMVQLSNPYMTIGKTIALTRRTSVSHVMSLLFNMLSRLVIAIECYFFFFFGIKLLYNVVLISAEQWSESAIYVCIYPLPLKPLSHLPLPQHVTFWYTLYQGSQPEIIFFL